MNNSYDYIIIGGGLLGCATAYSLARYGAKRVALFDRNDIGSQATARAACLLTRTRSKLSLMQMVEETFKCIEEIETLTGDSLEVQQCGSITIATSESSLNNLQAQEQYASSFGIPNQRLTADQTKELLPWIKADSVTSALYMPTDGFVDAAMLCAGYARAAKLLGVECYSRKAVAEILTRGNAIEGVKLEDGTIIKAPKVINAGGSWANLLMRPLGVGLPFSPVRSHFYISEPREDIFPTGHPYAIIPDARAFTRSDLGALMIGLRESECLAFNPSELSASIEDFDFERGSKWTVLNDCAPGFKNYFPEIDELGIAHYVSGPSCYVPDAMFVVGKIEAYDGLYTACGCCGAGVAVGGGIGRLMAEIVLEKETFVDASQFSPSRFGDIDPFSVEFQKCCSDARSNKKGG